MKTVAVIMAGGKSSRMGRDKALLPVDGRPLLSVLADQWRCVCDGLMIFADRKEQFAALDLGGVQIVEDTRPGAGFGTGVENVRHRRLSEPAQQQEGIALYFLRPLLTTRTFHRPGSR